MGRPARRAIDLCTCGDPAQNHADDGRGACHGCAQTATPCLAFTPHPQPRRDTVAIATVGELMRAQDYGAVPQPTTPAVSELAARAITGGAGMAREYATAAGELLRTADVNVNARKNAARLLRLALAHLEA